ncbi:MAG: tRNA pseudouridine(38-40) synthase TruA [Gammaproteobacteria bacterium]|nr:tRNA pseudouridine(38-40) synthase TruA [Gammaproteobacteria bacterium]
MRYAMGVEYDGTNYYGFQSQDNPQLETIQQKLEQAISSVADHKISLIPAGRTDAGVHATNQVIHFDTEAVREDHAWLMGVNTNLPKDISVKWIKRVADDFHARYFAKYRKYQYFIFNSPVRSALWHQKATVIYTPLDENKMHEAAQAFIGEHDFTSFRSAQCQSKTAMRNIHHIKIERMGLFVLVEIQANAFLHHMVRNIVGVLLEIGSGKKEINWAKEVLAKKDRKYAGITAPPDGLYLVEVGY